MLLHFCTSTHTPKKRSTLRVLSVVPNIGGTCSTLLQPPVRNPRSMVGVKAPSQLAEEGGGRRAEGTDICFPPAIFCSLSARTSMISFIIVLRMRI